MVPQPPVELGYELDPVGVNRFFGTLPNGFSAHPKYDPATGELHAMAHQWPDLVDHVRHIVVGRDGRVSKVTDIPVPDMPMIHDMSLTATYAVVHDLPVTVDLDVVVAGFPWPFTWAPDPCYVLHPLNADDADDGTVVVDLCRYDRMMDTDRTGPFGDCTPTFDGWVIDPVGTRVHETRLDDRPQEFPRHHPGVGTQPHRAPPTRQWPQGPDPRRHRVAGWGSQPDDDDGAVRSNQFRGAGSRCVAT